MAALAVGLIVVASRSDAGSPEDESSSGAVLYDRLCLACHGEAGDGDGPAASWLWPRPRDFTRGAYAWRSTSVGAAPTDEDLAATIRWGIRGTSMPGFAATLGDREIAELVAVLKGFAPDVFVAPGAPLARAPRPANVSLEPRRGAGPRPEAEPSEARTRGSPRAAKEIDRGRALWASQGCASCHGDGARGDGVAGKQLRDAEGRLAPPYDLTTQPLRRPRPDDSAIVAAIRDSIATGLAGTAMPGYAGIIGDDDLWALASYIDSLRTRTEARDPWQIDPVAIQLDRADKLVEAGLWPGRGRDDVVFGHDPAPQGSPPASLAPAQASLDADRCARCHAKQAREWRGSIHAAAGSPGLVAQDGELSPKERRSCQRCHGPLPEQRDDDGLRHQGVTCAACHVRGWTRHGPPRASATRLGLPRYPLIELPIYERGDLCLGCHQLPPRLAVAGKPLLNTYIEWLRGPYMRRGIQCQHCHMPDREHTFKGVHDRDTFREGIKLEAIAARAASGTVSVRARLWNAGAGHMLPTTTTPAAWLEVELVDDDGDPIRGASARRRIGRDMVFDGKQWHEREDSRIPPGGSIELAAAWRRGRVDRATHARVRVRVVPDDYYIGFYEARLDDARGEARRQYQAALARARAASYVAEERLIEVRR
jgi:mono/diheme cytochrome c family protein